MKKIPALLLGLVGLLVGAVLLSGCSSSGSVQTVDPQAWLDQAGKPGVVTLDVRTPAEYAAGHVSGAVNVDVESSTFDQQLAQLDKATTYTVYCRSGNRSKVASGKMADAGFSSVYNLAGGLTDLAGAGAQVVTS